MTESNKECQAHIVLGQKYAYATISLILGLACFINLAGMEKAVLAVIFGWMALKATPAPGSGRAGYGRGPALFWEYWSWSWSQPLSFSTLTGCA